MQRRKQDTPRKQVISVEERFRQIEGRLAVIEERLRAYGAGFSQIETQPPGARVTAEKAELDVLDDELDADDDAFIASWEMFLGTSGLSTQDVGQAKKRIREIKESKRRRALRRSLREGNRTSLSHEETAILFEVHVRSVRNWLREGRLNKTPKKRVYLDNKLRALLRERDELRMSRLGRASS